VNGLAALLYFTVTEALVSSKSPNLSIKSFISRYLDAIYQKGTTGYTSPPYMYKCIYTVSEKNGPLNKML